MNEKSTLPVFLGIETSCDETAAALVRADGVILSNVVRAQIDAHQAYGGVVPEIAARAHMEHLDAIVDFALTEAKMKLADVDGFAVTAGPGLIGGVIVGVMAAKAYASVTGKPLYPVNHLEGHALTARLTNKTDFPFLLLLVSGGHCQILLAEGVGKYTRLGGTLDDALGEAFDKVGKMMGLPYPGGPQIEKYALKGNPAAYALPRPLLGQPGCNFSFSGLKTAVRLLVDAEWDRQRKFSEEFIADVAASFQSTVAEVLHDRLSRAIDMVNSCEVSRPSEPSAVSAANNPLRAQEREQGHTKKIPKTLVVAGGVAANQFLRGEIEKLAEEKGMEAVFPPMALCTDNAAMIAWAALEQWNAGIEPEPEFEPRARWSLS